MNLFTGNFLREYPAEHFAEVAPTAQIRTFADTEKFFSEFRSYAFDLLILDIFMEPLNGIQVAKIVCNQNRDVPIVFLTSNDKYILAGYEVFVVEYILKPLVENVDRFAKTFAHVFSHNSLTNIIGQAFTWRTKNFRRRFNLDQRRENFQSAAARTNPPNSSTCGI
ncbi:MAG: response regulator [Quinella sp. 1Q7]|nr:response regulator [Quinella sp. 1Q7]